MMSLLEKIFHLKMFYLDDFKPVILLILLTGISICFNLDYFWSGFCNHLCSISLEWIMAYLIWIFHLWHFLIQVILDLCFMSLNLILIQTIRITLYLDYFLILWSEKNVLNVDNLLNSDYHLNCLRCFICSLNLICTWF